MNLFFGNDHGMNESKRLGTWRNDGTGAQTPWGERHRPPWGERHRRGILSATLGPVIFFVAMAIHPAVAADPDAAESAAPADVSMWLDAKMDAALVLYMDLHAHPEVSFQEEQTAEKLARLWQTLGLKVTRGVGGHGIVGIAENGQGPTVMLRTDLDGLPVTEETPLAFASKETVELPDGSSTGVMHACGHDVHMTN